MQQDFLATLKKHIGDVDFTQDSIDCADSMQITQSHSQVFSQSTESKKLRIYNFSEDIKSINEFAGALQTLQICFQKILKIARTDSMMESKEAQISDLIKECSFLGKGLFDSSMSANGGSITFENPSPMPLLEKDLQEFTQYIEEKLSELTQTLSLTSQKIIQMTTQSANSGLNNSALMNDFSKMTDFKSILK